MASADNGITEAEIRKLGAEMRMAFRMLLNAIWSLVDEELAEFPEARERVRRRLDSIRRRRRRTS